MKPADNQAPVIVLFRHDLRISDNRALHDASRSGKPVIAVFLWDEVTSPVTRPIGSARRWWLHHSLMSLARSLEGLGSHLVLRRGNSLDIVNEIVEQTGADTVLWNRRYDEGGIATDTALKSALSQRGLTAHSFEGQLLHEPYALKTGTGGFYRVYSPFWRALSTGAEPRGPVEAPKALRAWPRPVATDDLSRWSLLPERPDLAKGFTEQWTPGEEGALKSLAAFVEDAIEDYYKNRDNPGKEGTSRLSPHLAHGEITPFQIWDALNAADATLKGTGGEKFRKEIGWREFAWHLLFHRPRLHLENVNPAFDSFPWQNSDRYFDAWKRGRTGYPIVDAGMRQLWKTGWMHNRVRMVVASFLTKHLLVDWRKGEEWFWDTLVDADAGNNPASWQWVAGSGADAAPYFRIFNPVLQSRTYDPDGNYVRAFVPELQNLPDKYLHQPWAAPPAVLKAAGIVLGQTYPEPIVDHKIARKRALEVYSATMGRGETKPELGLWD